MGSAIVGECDRRGVQWVPGTRNGIMEVIQQIEDNHADLAINCAAFIPLTSVDQCKNHMDETIAGNVWWPSVLRDACEVTGIPIMHVSTGCLFDEQKEYTEQDAPTRGYAGYCGFYVGTKLLSERVVSHYDKHYILRMRLPFDEFSSPRNYLNKLAGFKNVFNHMNSLTHRGDFAKWALDLWEKRAPFGTYHCCNEGQISAVRVVVRMVASKVLPHLPQIVESPGATGARLSVKKLTDAGIKVRHVDEAVREAVTNFKL